LQTQVIMISQKKADGYTGSRSKNFLEALIMIDSIEFEHL
jgi:hypothetical protein